jgi:hypothetical protein
MSDVKEFVVFYAWQSDTDQRLNRHLIRIALELAAKKLSADERLGVRVRIDSDTEGVLGHVPVADTILKKIAVCDAFVPDLTFVARSDGGKFIPNANVMLEYGYALRARTHFVMMPVMNIAHGHAKELPFDMGHLRYPTLYDLPSTASNAERRAARRELAGKFEPILRDMISASRSSHEHQRTAQSSKQEAARRYLSPELVRTIERALYIHSRATVNFSCASADSAIKPNDRKEDFLPYRPTLYPSASEIRDLPASDAAALSAFYDSLVSLADMVNDWWGREDQLPVNIFNSIRDGAEKSLELGLACIDIFNLDENYPPKYEAHGTLTSRIKQSIASSAGTMKHHLARAESKAKNNPPPTTRPGLRRR